MVDEAAGVCKVVELAGGTLADLASKVPEIDDTWKLGSLQRIGRGVVRMMMRHSATGGIYAVHLARMCVNSSSAE